MAEVERKEEQEEELIPVGDGVEEEEQQLEDQEEEQEEQQDDERMGAGDEEEEEDGTEAKRAKRREERRTRKQRQREARERDNREMGFLRQRNEQLERRFSELDQRVGHSEVAQVDTRINDIKGKIKLADQVIAKSISQQDGDSYTEAQGIRDSLRDNLAQLEGAKQYMSQERAPAQAGPDPRLMQHASNWMQDHNWWDPNGGDEDSRTVSRLDSQLINEGLDPTTPEYWDTLSDRVEEALPHRFESDQGNGQRRPRKKTGGGGGPSFRTGGRERPLRKGEVYISPERKQAMIEAGVWEDPELRQKYLKSYQAYDSEHRS